MKNILLITVLLSFSTLMLAQKPIKNFRKGNELYRDEAYNEALEFYLKGLETDSTDVRGKYNFANTLYKQGEYDKSAEIYAQLLSENKLNNAQKSDVLHNLGNIALRSEDYENGIKAYKDALKLNPDDADTKYNLAYALQKMQQQQQQQSSQGDSKKDEDKKQQNQDKQEQQQQPNANKNEQKQEQKQSEQPDKMKKSDAERMLNAIDNQEKNTLEKKKKIKVQQVKTDKDW